jgi:hypothetical protein
METHARVRDTTAGPSLTSLAINLHNSTFVLVGMILILSSTLVLQYLCTIVSLYHSTPVLQYACTRVHQHYSMFVLQYNSTRVSLYYSTSVPQYINTIENDSHYHMRLCA